MVLDPMTGKPGPWIEDIVAWSDRVVLTPRHPALWSAREVILAEQVPIRIIPAIGNWIELLAASFGDRERAAKQREAVETMPLECGSCLRCWRIDQFGGPTNLVLTMRSSSS
jgi:hypothetical protein